MMPEFKFGATRFGEPTGLTRGLKRALYAGDDTTDLDAFAAVAELDLGVRVAVDSPEAPQVLVESADIVVAGPPAFLDLLNRL